jgi:hypothetical protein
MFSTATTYGNFDTPMITPIGMITGMGIDGKFVIRSNPIINVTDFFRPRYETPVYQTRSIGDVMDAAEKARERAYEYNKANNKEFQLNELKAQNAIREETEKKLALERAMRDAAEKALALEREQKLIEERAKREAAEKALADERAAKLKDEQKAHKLTAKSLSEYEKLMRTLAFKKLSSKTAPSTVSSSRISSIKSSGMSTISSATSASKMSAVESVISDFEYNDDGDDETEITFSDSASNTGSDTESDTGSDTDSDTDTHSDSADSDNESDVTKSTIIRTKKTIDPNEKSHFSNCTRCAKCFNGVSSVGLIIVTQANDDHQIFLGNSVTENAYCDYSQKLKSIGKRCELPSERAEKIFKRMTDIDYDIDQHNFIDIPIKDNLHVHRVYIIDFNSFKTKVEINVTTEYSNVALFSMNKMNQNIALYKNKQIYNSENSLCVINKRIQKVIDSYYNMFC